jgi:hypothetical protein
MLRRSSEGRVKRVGGSWACSVGVGGGHRWGRLVDSSVSVDDRWVIYGLGVSGRECVVPGVVPGSLRHRGVC